MKPGSSSSYTSPKKPLSVQAFRLRRHGSHIRPASTAAVTGHIAGVGTSRRHTRRLLHRQRAGHLPRWDRLATLAFWLLPAIIGHRSSFEPCCAPAADGIYPGRTGPCGATSPTAACRHRQNQPAHPDRQAAQQSPQQLAEDLLANFQGAGLAQNTAGPAHHGHPPRDDGAVAPGTRLVLLGCGRRDPQTGLADLVS